MLRKQKENKVKLEEKNKAKEKISLRQRLQNYKAKVELKQQSNKSKINTKLQNNEKMFAGGGTD